MLALALTLLILLANEPSPRIDSEVVWQIRLEIAEDSIQQLRKEPRVEVPAKLRIGIGPAKEVLVSLKGRGTFQTIDEKPSFTVHASGSPASYGTTKFHLNNSAEDVTFLKEMIGAEIFREAGIAAPRVSHAKVTLNNRALGLYVLKEGFTEEFLERHFGPPTGFLYDTDSSHNSAGTMEIDIGDRSAGDQKLKLIESAAEESNHARRIEKLGALLDFDSFLKFCALEIIICHWDGYALSQNNFRLYFGGEPKRFHFLPTGMDQILSKPDFPWKPPMAGLVARSIMETDFGRTNYPQYIRTLLTNSLNPLNLANRISAAREKLKPFLKRSEYETLLEETDQLAENIARRVESLQRQLIVEGSGVPTFIDGRATLTHWMPHDEPPGGNLFSNKTGLHIVAGPKTSASWQTKIHLSPGDYVFSAGASTRDVVPLPFGTRQGATLRVIGRENSGTSLLGTTDGVLRCPFQVTEAQQIILACELRASGGEVTFEHPLSLEFLIKK